ncbi:MAG: hypothetical protein DWQ49_07005 [Bacteroidetes bacterium]|nr:MAG: hypothetical protein DWQ49_07005 [Bacteroidota bacterium]
MSTPTRAELAGRIGTLKAVSEQLISEIKMLDERIAGLYAFIQMLPDYEETVEKLKEKAKENEEKV